MTINEHKTSKTKVTDYSQLLFPPYVIRRISIYLQHFLQKHVVVSKKVKARPQAEHYDALYRATNMKLLFQFYLYIISIWTMFHPNYNNILVTKPSSFV